MKLIVNNQIIQKLKEDFPHLSKKRYSNDNNEKTLKAYFIDSEQILREIVSIERTKSDENIHDYDFFKDILNYCKIKLSEEDLDLYLKELFDCNYHFNIVKTMIPFKKYDIEKQETVSSLKNALFAVSDIYDIDLEHVYTLDEIKLLQNQNIIRFLKLEDNYKKISSHDFSSINHDYEKSNIVPIDNKVIDKYNYLKLINNYPYLFTYIRNNIDYANIDELLGQYEMILSETVNKEIKECEESVKRINDIKKLTLHF